MLSINKIYFYLFLLIWLMQIPSLVALPFLDEFVILLLLILIALDMFVNRSWGRYKYLFYVVGIMAFYAIYSILFCDFNTNLAIINDAILQMKPFLPFFIAYIVAPVFTPRMKSWLKMVCYITSSLLLIISMTPYVEFIVGHYSQLGTMSMNSFLLYVYCSWDDKYKLSKKDLVIALILLSIGLTGMRSKFYGAYVMSFYFLFFYKPGMLKSFNIKHLLLLLIGIAGVLIVTWEKIIYYFVEGLEPTSFDDETIQSFARPVLYITAWTILLDFPLFGTGLASYATHSSSPEINYSKVYGEYGIENVWGLSEQMPDFICDAYYAELAQFGFVGIALFVLFWRWIYKRLCVNLRHEGRLPFVIGSIIVVFLLIECTTECFFIQSGGIMTMSLLGMILSTQKHVEVPFGPKCLRILKTQFTNMKFYYNSQYGKGK